MMIEYESKEVRAQAHKYCPQLAKPIFEIDPFTLAGGEVDHLADLEPGHHCVLMAGGMANIARVKAVTARKITVVELGLDTRESTLVREYSRLTGAAWGDGSGHIEPIARPRASGKRWGDFINESHRNLATHFVNTTIIERLRELESGIMSKPMSGKLDALRLISRLEAWVAS